MADTRQPQDADRKAKTRSPGFAAGSEGWSGDEDADEPVVSAARNAADAAGNQEAQQVPPQDSGNMQSDYSLSQPSGADDDDGRFEVAEEHNFDQQSDAARHIGQMTLDLGIDDDVSEPQTETRASRRKKAELKQSLDRAVPRS